jgi:hypothetical protein
MPRKRYCGMCDRMVSGRECPRCGADTDALDKAEPEVIDLMDALRRALPKIWHTCHDMNPPFPGPCAACERERSRYLRGGGRL